MSKNTVAFIGFAGALGFGGIEAALKISVSTVFVLILSWLSVRIPFLFDGFESKWINRLFIVTVWSTAAQIILHAFGTSDKDMILCFAANLAVSAVLFREFKELLSCSAAVIILSAVIGLVPFVSSLALGFIAAGLITAVFSRRQNA